MLDRVDKVCVFVQLELSRFDCVAVIKLKKKLEINEVLNGTNYNFTNNKRELYYCRSYYFECF